MPSGHGPSTAEIPTCGESPRARDPIALAPGITEWRVACREIAWGSEGNVKLRQRSRPPIPACSRWGDPTMPPHHVKVSGPKGLTGWRGGGGILVAIVLCLRQGT